MARAMAQSIAFALCLQASMAKWMSYEDDAQHSKAVNVDKRGLFAEIADHKHSFLDLAEHSKGLEEEHSFLFRGERVKVNGSTGWTISHDEEIAIAAMLDVLNPDNEIDKADCVWGWTNDDTLDTTYGAVLWGATTYKEALLNHMIFQHGLGPIAASRLMGEELGYLATRYNEMTNENPRQSVSTTTDEVEDDMRYYTRIMREYLLSDPHPFAAAAEPLTLNALRHMHAFDHHSGERHQASYSYRALDLVKQFGVYDKGSKAYATFVKYRTKLMKGNFEAIQEGLGDRAKYWPFFMQEWLQEPHMANVPRYTYILDFKKFSAGENIIAGVPAADGGEWVIVGEIDYGSKSKLVHRQEIHIPLSNDRYEELKATMGTTEIQPSLLLQRRMWNEDVVPFAIACNNIAFDIIRDESWPIWGDETYEYMKDAVGCHRDIEKLLKQAPLVAHVPKTHVLEPEDDITEKDTDGDTGGGSGGF
mmetsp:Transcript_18991/g.34286  ORF Transcript_18991/g.34286 Transcript_18991/m.34286 type:complete len:476 (+) Transcript_18991:37-1464(+)